MEFERNDATEHCSTAKELDARRKQKDKGTLKNSEKDGKKNVSRAFHVASREHTDGMGKKCYNFTSRCCCV